MGRKLLKGTEKKFGQRSWVLQSKTTEIIMSLAGKIGNRVNRTLTDAQAKYAAEKMGCKVLTNQYFLYKINGMAVIINQYAELQTPKIIITMKNVENSYVFDEKDFKDSLPKEIEKKIKEINLGFIDANCKESKTVLTFDVKSTLAKDKGIDFMMTALDSITNCLKEKGYLTCCSDCQDTENIKLVEYYGTGFTIMCQTCVEKRIAINGEKTSDDYLVKNEKPVKGSIITFIAGWFTFLFILLLQDITSELLTFVGTGFLTALCITILYGIVAEAFTNKSIVITSILSIFFVSMQVGLLSLGFDNDPLIYTTYVGLVLGLVLGVVLSRKIAKIPVKLTILESI